MSQEPTPSGRTREDFRKKENGNKEETKTESASSSNDIEKKAKLLIEKILERKEFWIFFSGLLIGYILGRG